MKKTLIAIAALAATGAFAQSTVTMSGVVDMAYMSQSTQAAAVTGTPYVAGTTESGTPGTVGYVAPVAAKAGVASSAAGEVRTNTFERNGSSTSALNIAGVEDLGGGMKASFFFESNWSPANGAASTFANGQTFLGLEGGYGSIKLGAANSAVLQTALNGDSFGTAVGGNYTGRFSLTGNGTGTRLIRTANSARFDTKVMNGFSGSYELSFANKNMAGTETTSTGVNVIGLRYAAGPLTVAYANARTSAIGTTAADTTTTQNLLSANYAAGAATFYGGFTNYKTTASNTTSDQTSSFNLGLKYAVSGTTTVQASMAKRSDKVTTVNPQNASLFSMGADYAMSKRTTAYARYETIDTNRASDTTGKTNIWAFGIKHAF